MSDPEKQLTPISGHSLSRTVSGSTLHRDDYRRREMEATEAAIIPPEDADKTLGDDDFPDGGFEAWLVCGGVSFFSFPLSPRAVFVNGRWCSLFLFLYRLFAQISQREPSPRTASTPFVSATTDCYALNM